jgi:uncharacterized protein (TIGR02118 family)
MPGAKIVVLYPPPTDVEAFERVFFEEHVPLAKEKVSGVTKYVLAIVRSGLGGDAPYHRVNEIHFPSMEVLQASAATAGTQEAAAHAIAISSGGPPLFLIADAGDVFMADGTQPADAAAAV